MLPDRLSDSTTMVGIRCTKHLVPHLVLERDLCELNSYTSPGDRISDSFMANTEGPTGSYQFKTSVASAQLQLSTKSRF